MTSGISLQPSTPGRVQSGGAVAAAIDLDAALMLRVRDGDPACFAQLLERHRTPVINFLFRMVQNKAIAEELAQEVFLRVYRSRLSYEASAKFTTWLFRIATNLAFNWLRDEKNLKSQDSLQDDTTSGATRKITDGQPSVESVLVNQVKLHEVREAIAKLPAKQRAAILMHKYEEMEYAQIAKVLCCSESAVKSLLFRAYESLRARLAQYA
ncbi:RNA polymerase sigma factor [Paludibaculum fermentans]|uniref:RNA polymerase sigma factor n=1 Tax=Paludibaculum fermentans TaxID=1473598 RepID=UPI003EB9B972